MSTGGVAMRLLVRARHASSGFHGCQEVPCDGWEERVHHILGASGLQDFHSVLLLHDVHKRDALIPSLLHHNAAQMQHGGNVRTGFETLLLCRMNERKNCQRIYEHSPLRDQ